MVTTKTATGKPSTTARARTTPKTTARKPSAAKPSAPTRIPAPPANTSAITPDLPVTLAIDAAAQAKPEKTNATNTMKIRDLVDQVVEKTGVKKKGLKEIIEVTLGCIGDALSKGDDLNLPPLGKVKINRQKDKDVGEMIVLKLHRGGGKPKAGKTAKEALADSDD